RKRPGPPGGGRRARPSGQAGGRLAFPAGEREDPAAPIAARPPCWPSPGQLSSGAVSNVTRILNAICAGDPHAAAQLLPLVYEELRRLAAQRLAHEKPGQTLQPTALVHEAYLRLVGDGAPAHWDGRGHFFAAAAEAMRRILVENARRKRSRKHGGGL